MKYILFPLLLVVRLANAQSEFVTYENGLIYAPATMKHLSTIVDSLNLRFRQCEASQVYRSLEQGRGYWVDVPDDDAKKLVASGISLVDYQKKVKHHNTKPVYLVKQKYTNWQGEKIISYGEVTSQQSSYSVDINDIPVNDKTHGWVSNGYSLFAFWIENLNSQPLPLLYTRAIQYVDCMVDTSARIFSLRPFSEYDTTGRNMPENKFVAWAMDFPGKPVESDYLNITSSKEFEAVSAHYFAQYKKWDSARLARVYREMRASNRVDFLRDAVKEAIEKKQASAELEFYALKYLSKKQSLALMRIQQARGTCSQDMRPREQAAAICMLAAETGQWDIFLRSHLDIMNDRFDRVSDGSWMRPRRKTYFSELEQLNIDAVNLLIGSCLRVSNVNQEHYESSVSRAGRALTDAKNFNDVETKLLAIIADDQLDWFNRYVMTNTMRAYIAETTDEARKKSCSKKLNEAIGKMPMDLRSVVK